jgi:hypothetical protein
MLQDKRSRVRDPIILMNFSIYLIIPATLHMEFANYQTEMSTRSRKIMLLGSRARPVRKTNNLTVICEPLSRQCGIHNISQPYRPSRPVTGLPFLSPRELELKINYFPFCCQQRTVQLQPVTRVVTAPVQISCCARRPP